MTNDEEIYEEAIIVAGFCHEERKRKIMHDKKLDEAQCLMEIGKGTESSRPESSINRP
jgi:hypothetical protein